MNKILNVLIGILLLASLATGVSAMKAVAQPATQLQSIVVAENPVPQFTSISAMSSAHNVVLMSEMSNAYGQGKGKFAKPVFDAFVPLNIGANTMEAGTYQIVYFPDEGFAFDSFVATDGVSIVNQNGEYVDVDVTGDGSLIAYYADIQAPSVSTQGGTYVSYGGPMSVTITALASDNHMIDRVKLTIDGNEYNMDETSPGVYEHTLSLAPGTHAYDVEARDEAHLTSTVSDIVTVNTVVVGDTIPPVISNLADQTVTAGSNDQATVTITADVVDNVGVASVTLTINGQTYNMASFTSQGYTYTVTLPVGTHTATVTAVDASGNTATDSATITVNPYTANSGGNTGSNGGSSGGSTSRRLHNGGVSGVTGPVPTRPTDGGVVEQPKPVVEPIAPVEPVQAPAEVVAPAPKQSFWQWSIFKTAAFNVLLLTLILLALLVFR